MIAQKVIIHNLCLAQYEERPKMCSIDEFKHSCSSMAKYHCTRKRWVLKARLKQNTNLASECWNLLNPKLLLVDGTALQFFPNMMCFANNFNGFALVQSLLIIAKCIERLAIGCFVPSEPLPNA